MATSFTFPPTCLLLPFSKEARYVGSPYFGKSSTYMVKSKTILPSFFFLMPPIKLGHISPIMKVPPK